VALTPRGKIVTALVGACVFLMAGVGALALTGHAPAPLQHVVDTVTGHDDPPPTCPLTGRAPADGRVPQRTALGVKVENTDDAYPLAGLEGADLVYEEVVEGGITRFIAIYQCGEADRVGPVRSARTTDPKILLQMAEHPLLGYSGAADKVNQIVEDSGIIGMTEASDPAAFSRDDARYAPHDLFTGTAALYHAAGKVARREGPPDPVFAYDPEIPKPSKRVRTVDVSFSDSNVASWTWSKGRWQRLLDGSPMLLEGGAPLVTDNIVIQQVVVTDSGIIDAAGYPSPEVTMTGTGKAWVLRNGKLIVGRWERPEEGDLTVFVTKHGDQIHLKPGTAFVELVPKGRPVTFGT
jgi:Protein of unknown function (DUF3048) N-terminal domain/Protein of unknown function (DUF3048) C-terminal domain